jgi:ABC-type Fe3+ transport system substrate-binding protein
LSRIMKGALGALAVLAVTNTELHAQSANAEWNATLAKAKTQTLVMVNQGNKGFDAVIEEFTKKFGIKVEASAARPTVILPRVRTEQGNGQYLWDIWWATTSNMVGVAAPAGMLQPFEPFLMLPEVKEVSNWRHPSYIYGDAKRFVFTHSHEVTVSAYHNVSVVPDVPSIFPNEMLNPKIKGKIVLRDASQPNAGAWALAPLYKAKGADFLRKFLTEMEPRVLDNPQQIDTAILRGGATLAIGMQSTSYSQCIVDGGCKNIEPIRGLAAASSRGLSIFKNAPNPEATKIFVNWLLSKEGQTLFVKEWAKYNSTGAVSMRKDVAPAPKHEDDLPDFSKPEQYVWVATDDGAKEIEAVVNIFKEIMRK